MTLNQIVNPLSVYAFIQDKLGILIRFSVTGGYFRFSFSSSPERGSTWNSKFKISGFSISCTQVLFGFSKFSVQFRIILYLIKSLKLLKTEKYLC